MSTFTAAQPFRAAFITMLGTLFPFTSTGVQVVRGDAAFDPYQASIAVMGVEVESQMATFSSTQRSREENLELDLRFTFFAAGGEEAEVAAETGVYDLLEAVETQVRVTDTTLGGVVRHCFLERHEGTPITPQEMLYQGRLHAVMATFTAVNRITGS